MPYADNNGIQIHYEIEGTGPPVVLLHWSFATLDDWYDYGWVDALKADYRLILLDARGHGRSDKCYTAEDYALERRVSDVVAVLDAERIARSHFFGYSMGGWVGFGLAKYVPQRFRSLIIGGQHPYAQSLQELREIVQYGIDNGHEAFIIMWEKDIGILTAVQKERMRMYNFQALLAVAHDRESLEDVLPGMTMPCLLIVGENDGVKQAAQKCLPQIPNGRLVVVPGIDHFGGFRQSDIMLPYLKGFWESIPSA